MTTKPLLSKSSTRRLQAVINTTPHAVLIAGDITSNNNDVAEWLARQVAFTNDLASADIYTIGRDKANIEEVRALQSVTKHRAGASGALYRVVVILNLDQLRADAQNALLKAVEEPAEGVVYILSTYTLTKILPTIRSRTNIVRLTQPAEADYSQAYPEVDIATISSAILATGGAWPEFTEYVAGDTAELDLAKQLRSESRYERMKSINDLSKDRDRAIRVVRYLQNIYVYVMRQQIKQSKVFDNSKIAACLEAVNALEMNASTKLVLTRLMSAL